MDAWRSLRSPTPIRGRRMAMGWVTSIRAGARASTIAGAMLLALSATADPARLDGLQLAGHDAVDPALQRFTAKVTRLGQPDKAGRIATLRFEPIGPGMLPP